MRRFYSLDDYSQYFKTNHWWDLKYEYLTANREAKCFVCHTKSTLLLHHVNYRALYREKLDSDVYILCYDCHNRVHFWFFRLIKVPLNTNSLLFAMRIRRSIYCMRSGQIGLSILWFITAIIIGAVYLIAWLLWQLLVDKPLKLLLE